MNISCERCRERLGELLEREITTAVSAASSPPAAASSPVAEAAPDSVTRRRMAPLRTPIAAAPATISAVTDDVELIEMARHIEECPQCVADLRLLRAAHVTLRDLPSMPPPPDLPARIRQSIAASESAAEVDSSPAVATVLPVAAAPQSTLRQGKSDDGWLTRWTKALRRFGQRPGQVAWAGGFALAAFCVMLVIRRPEMFHSATEMPAASDSSPLSSAATNRSAPAVSAPSQSAPIAPPPISKPQRKAAPKPAPLSSSKAPADNTMPPLGTIQTPLLPAPMVKDANAAAKPAPPSALSPRFNQAAPAERQRVVQAQPSKPQPSVAQPFKSHSSIPTANAKRTVQRSMEGMLTDNVEVSLSWLPEKRTSQTPLATARAGSTVFKNAAPRADTPPAGGAASESLSSNAGPRSGTEMPGAMGGGGMGGRGGFGGGGFGGGMSAPSIPPRSVAAPSTHGAGEAESDKAAGGATSDGREERAAGRFSAQDALPDQPLRRVMPIPARPNVSSDSLPGAARTAPAAPAPALSQQRRARPLFSAAELARPKNRVGESTLSFGLGLPTRRARLNLVPDINANQARLDVALIAPLTDKAVARTVWRGPVRRGQRLTIDFDLPDLRTPKLPTATLPLLEVSIIDERPLAARGSNTKPLWQRRLPLPPLGGVTPQQK